MPDLLDLPPDALYSARLPMAMAYAAVMHSPQKRKDDLGTPLHHPSHGRGVVGVALRSGVPAYESEIEDLVIAALLHDVPEDAGGDNRLREIGAMFGPASQRSCTPRPTVSPPIRTRKSRGGPQGAAHRPRAAPGRPHRQWRAHRRRRLPGDRRRQDAQPGGTAAAVAVSGDTYLERFSGV